MRETDIIDSGGARNTNIVPDRDGNITKGLETLGTVYWLFKELVVH